ncbi:MAG: HIT domain-containing protein [Armatimonadota bacterium]|nr:HIT domain-containing protein [Armatimonadota bacterium]MDR7450285.1 HIT domain-containing protein [Armatimonadota bacterium]MDR7467132.1 HIT domain-containing protein [Armatimonadota bacterium]MDR7493326.1 HIT domain-containing protein [Armatimonadota bacterium]MDR7499334.1 HIT domain-containing protein [Armatimonadota bacterium]
MRHLWAPWRLEYIQAEKSAGCIFCLAAAGIDREDSLVVAHSRRAFVLLNLYPYNSGHVMVAPIRHKAALRDLDDEELLDLSRLVDRTVRVLERVLRPEGYNIGLNLGRAAGAGVEDHLHVHVVPRWVGDTNFMPVLAETKVLPEHLRATRARLAEGFAALAAEEQ